MFRFRRKAHVWATRSNEQIEALVAPALPEWVPVPTLKGTRKATRMSVSTTPSARKRPDSVEQYLLDVFGTPDSRVGA